MPKYLVEFSVDGRRTEQIVPAKSSMDAKKFIEAQYPNSKVVFGGCKPVK